MSFPLIAEADLAVAGVLLPASSASGSGRAGWVAAGRLASATAANTTHAPAIDAITNVPSREPELEGSFS